MKLFVMLDIVNQVHHSVGIELQQINKSRRATFYGSSSLRILYGLDRFSEGLYFSLLDRLKTLIG